MSSVVWRRRSATRGSSSRACLRATSIFILAAMKSARLPGDSIDETTAIASCGMRGESSMIRPISVRAVTTSASNSVPCSITSGIGVRLAR